MQEQEYELDINKPMAERSNLKANLRFVSYIMKSGVKKILLIEAMPDGEEFTRVVNLNGRWLESGEEHASDVINVHGELSVVETESMPPATHVPRKIIQITAGASDLVYALCNDGSVFYEPATHGANGWTKLPPIPQPEEHQQ